MPWYREGLMIYRMILVDRSVTFRHIVLVDRSVTFRHIVLVDRSVTFRHIVLVDRSVTFRHIVLVDRSVTFRHVELGDWSVTYRHIQGIGVSRTDTYRGSECHVPTHIGDRVSRTDTQNQGIECDEPTRRIRGSGVTNRHVDLRDRVSRTDTQIQGIRVSRTDTRGIMNMRDRSVTYRHKRIKDNES